MSDPRKPSLDYAPARSVFEVLESWSFIVCLCLLFFVVGFGIGAFVVMKFRGVI